MVTMAKGGMDAAGDKAAYFKQLYDLGQISDDDENILNQEDNRPSRKRQPHPQITPGAGPQEGNGSTLLRASSAPTPSSSNRDIVHETPPVPNTLKTKKPTGAGLVHTSDTKTATSNPSHQSKVAPPRRTVSNPVPETSSSVLSLPAGSTLGKRKRKDAQIKLRSPEEQVFRGLTFFYIPNDDIAPARRARIAQALQYGVSWTTVLSDSVTHIVVDKGLTYKDIISYLKIPAIPSRMTMVNETYPLDCIAFRAILISTQKQYMVKGHKEAIEEALQDLSNSEIATSSAGSVQSLQLKPQQSKPGKWDFVPPRNTPPRSEESTQGALAMAEAVNQQRDVSDVSLQKRATYGNALDDLIKEARKVEHLPLDKEDESPPSSQEASNDPVDSDDEDARPVSKRLPPRSKKYSGKGSFNQESFSCMKGGTGADLSSNPNARTIAVLQEMADFYTSINDTWRPIAYRKAISTLRQQKTKVTTAEEAFGLPFVGQRIALKIEEIVVTNRLRRLDNAKADPSDQILRLFMNIYGAGSSQASKWMQQGHKTLGDLVAKATLTDNQRIGIEHYDDFMTRIPREEVTALGEVVKKTAHSIDEKVEVIIGGSYRRGAASSGDIDCIVTKPGTQSSTELISVLHQLVTQLTSDKFLVAALSVPRSEAGSKWHGCCVLPGSSKEGKPIWRRIDFLLVPASELGAALIYFTGNDIFNRSIRLLASKKGMRLNQRGLYKDVMRGPGRVKITEGELVEGADEKKIFEILGVPWRPPEERIC